MTELYKGFIIHTHKYASYREGCDYWSCKVIMTIGNKKKNIKTKGRLTSEEMALKKAKAYIEEFAEERMKHGFVLNGKRIYPTSH